MDNKVARGGVDRGADLHYSYSIIRPSGTRHGNYILKKNIGRCYLLPWTQECECSRGLTKPMPEQEAGQRVTPLSRMQQKWFWHTVGDHLVKLVINAMDVLTV